MIPNRINRAIKKAFVLAQNNNLGMINAHAALLIKNGRVVAEGVNKRKTHPRSGAKYNLIHAEIDAILGVSEKQLAGATLIVVRAGYKNRQVLTISRPCLSCQSILYNTPIKDVFYSISYRQVGRWIIKKDHWSVHGL